MSFNSIHMAKENHIDGIRIMVIVASYVDAFAGCTWDNIAERLSGIQSYGNTKYVDGVIVAYLFKNYFNVTRAARDIGYAINHMGDCPSLITRIKRLNIKNIYKVYVGLMVNGLLESKHI